MSQLGKYMDDPEITHEPTPLREVHAIRLMMYDETKNMSPTELNAYYEKAVKEAREQYEIPPSQRLDFGKKKIV